MAGDPQPIDGPGSPDAPVSAFESINFDLIVNLPKMRRGHDAIMVIVDRLTKAGIFVPTTSNYTAQGLAEIFFEHVVRRGWIPTKFITDRDPKLVKSCWATISKKLRMTHARTAAWHAQADGAAERLNQTLEIATRNYVGPRQDTWNDELGMLELSYNTLKHESTGTAPYSLLYVTPHDAGKKLLHPHMDTRDTTTKDTENPVALEMIENARNRIKDSQEAITAANSKMKRQYDKRHSPMLENPIKLKPFCFRDWGKRVL